MATDTVKLPERPHDHAMDALGHEPVRPVMSFYVYEWPVRIWHWLTALLIVALALTGYFIASPLPSVSGDPSALFAMGRIREWHFIAAWLLTIGVVFRAYWAVVGGEHARLIYYVPFWSKQWWSEVFIVVKWYLFLGKGEKWVGHNPLARASMFGMFTLGSLAMVVTGFGLYAEQASVDSWLRSAFGWTLTLFGSSMSLRTWHHAGMYLLLAFSAIHLYAAVRDDIMGRVSTISSMISGWRTFRDFHDD